MSRLLTLVVAVFLSCLLAEGLLRVLWPVDYRSPTPVWNTEPGTWRKLLHRPSSVPGLNYELAPDMEEFFEETLIRTNRFGMRDTDPASAKGDSLVRVAVLGDSFTFGLGVEGEETYPNVLEVLLNERAASDLRRFEVLNFGVSGYSSRDEALVLKHKALEFDPDLVVLGYVLNDPETEPIQPLHRFFAKAKWWEWSHFLRLIVQAKNDWQSRGFVDTKDNIRNLNSHRGKWREMQRALRDMREVTRERHIEVIALIFPLMPHGATWDSYPYEDIHESVAAFASEIGMHPIDLLPIYASFGIRKVFGRNRHPTPFGHEIAARLLCDTILEDSARYLPALHARHEMR